jgi:hypothetical protein
MVRRLLKGRCGDSPRVSIGTIPFLDLETQAVLCFRLRNDSGTATDENHPWCEHSF